MWMLTEMVLDEMRKALPSNGKVTLFQSLNNVQIMLPELGFVNALRAYFELHKIDYVIDERPNVEYMSPDGQLPLIRCGTQLVSGYRPIIEFINQEKNIQPKGGDEHQSTRERHMMLFENIVPDSELYYTWMNNDIFENYTKSNYSYGQPWPIGNILTYLKRLQVEKSLGDCTNKQNELEELFNQISRMIDDKEIMDEILCLFYGHLKAILQCEKPYEVLANTVKMFPELIDFVEKFGEKIHSANN